MMYYLKQALREANDDLNYKQRLQAQGGESKAAVKAAEKRVAIILTTIARIKKTGVT